VLLDCQGFLFDLDGVLVDSRAVVERTWQRWARLHGVDPMPFIRVAHGRRAGDTLRSIAPHMDIEKEVAWLDAAELEDLAGLVAVPGATRFLAELPASRWAIVTSCGPELARRRLQAAGVPIPAALVTAADTPHGKPAPDGYRIGASRLGQDPGVCLVFEDSPAGVSAARAAGARVVGLTTTHSADRLMGIEGAIADFTQIDLQRQNGGFAVALSGPGSRS
jgi:sugar-phosphatase